MTYKLITKRKYYSKPRTFNHKKYINIYVKRTYKHLKDNFAKLHTC